jgi:hypothetical protein
LHFGNIDNIEFSFNGKSIPLSTSHKNLGVILSQNAKWNEHLENMIIFGKNKKEVVRIFLGAPQLHPGLDKI